MSDDAIEMRIMRAATAVQNDTGRYDLTRGLDDIWWAAGSIMTNLELGLLAPVQDACTGKAGP